MKKKVLVTARSFGKFPEDYGYFPEDEYEMLPNPYWGKTLTEEQMCELIPEANAVIIGVENMTDRIYRMASKLKIVQRMGAGYDNVYVELASKYGVAVANVPGATTNSVAELTIAFMLNLAHRVLYNNRRVQDGMWVMDWGVELVGKTLGIIGFGRIGQEVARKAKVGFGMKVIVFDFCKATSFAEKLGVQFAESLDEIYATSDVISLHIPCTSDTVNLIDKKAIKKMKDGVMLVNTARGGIINEKALYEALKEGKVSGAAADVLSCEPMMEKPVLLSCEHYIQTSHIGANSKDAAKVVSKIAAENIVNYLNGKYCENIVNYHLMKVGE